MRSMAILPTPSSPLPSPSTQANNPNGFSSIRKPSLSLPHRHLLFTSTAATSSSPVKEELSLGSDSSFPPPYLHHRPPPSLFLLYDRNEQSLIDQRVLRNRKHLRELSSWGIGGPCRYFLELSHASQLPAAIRYCRARSMPFMVIGKGSNCLFDDRGFDGLVVLNRLDQLQAVEPGVYRVGSGYPFNRLGARCSAEGFSGLEFAGGIPGTAGGAVFMNAGADGQDTGSVIDSVEIVTTDGEVRELRRSDMAFGYRWSSFQGMKDLAAITAATFRLTPAETARERQRAFLERRRKTQPIGERSAGSVFRNPLGLGVSAGKLIELAGLKGFEIGGAKVSTLHANFFINFNGSTSADMLALIKHVKERVDLMFGIELKEEVKYIAYRTQII